LNRLIRYQG